MAFMRLNKIAFIAIALGLTFLFILWMTNQGHSNPNTLKIYGNVEITDIEVSFKIPGRVDKRLVEEGEFIHAGQLVAVLDSSELMHEVELRQADVAASEANLLQLANGYLPEEIAQAKAKQTKASVDLKLQETDFKRQKQLFSQRVISQKEFDTSKAAYDRAFAEFRESSEYLSLLKKGTRVEKIDQAEANLEQAKQSLTLAEIRLGYANLYSPITGNVLSKNVESGEYVIAGTPVITVGSLDNVWIRAYIGETELGLIKLNQPVDVMTDSYPGKIYPGHISYISQEAEFTPKNVQTQKERVKLVYRVKIDVPNPNSELKPGMPADCIIHLQP
jgi:HlyD family secretion protein